MLEICLQLTLRVWTGFDGVEQFHVADVVDVDLVLQHNDESLSVELDREDGRWECQLANGGLTLFICRLKTRLIQVRKRQSIVDNACLGIIYLGINDLQSPR